MGALIGGWIGWKSINGWVKTIDDGERADKLAARGGIPILLPPPAAFIVAIIYDKTFPVKELTLNFDFFEGDAVNPRFARAWQGLNAERTPTWGHLPGASRAPGAPSIGHYRSGVLT
jgi:hypothetical protein